MEDSISRDFISLDLKQEESCPRATIDIAVNLKNRQKAIDDAGYGPLNPKEPNNEFWREKGERWDVSRSEARKQICGNCAAFSVTKKMLNCINEGISAGSNSDAWDTIDAGELGYCEAFDFKCAASRTCDAWIVGGPIRDENQQSEAKSLDQQNPDVISIREKEVSDYLYSLSDDDFDILFPSNESPTDEEAKWIFDVGGAFLRRALTNRRKRRKRKSVVDNIDMDVKAKKKPVLKDPDGGLTAAGRKYFNEKEGAKLRPGVKGPADTPMKMRRKGSFLVRFFTNPRGPMKDEKGRPTRLALSAAAWGEPVPQNMESARKLAEKGRKLLDRYRRLQESKKKSINEGISIKELGAPIGNTSGTVAGQDDNKKKRGNYDPNARDADGDGTVQEGTDYARSIDSDKNKRSGTADAQERRAAATNANTPKRAQSADMSERQRMGDHLVSQGFDKMAVKKFSDLLKAEANKLKPGQKTNWFPGRLPNGGRIANDGTYISPDVVRREDKTISDQYKTRRNKPAATSSRGTAGQATNKPKKRTGTADSMERSARKAGWSSGPRTTKDKNKNKPLDA